MRNMSAESPAQDENPSIHQEHLGTYHIKGIEVTVVQRHYGGVACIPHPNADEADSDGEEQRARQAARMAMERYPEGL